MWVNASYINPTRGTSNNVVIFHVRMTNKLSSSWKWLLSITLGKHCMRNSPFVTPDHFLLVIDLYTGTKSIIWIFAKWNCTHWNLCDISVSWKKGYTLFCKCLKTRAASQQSNRVTTETLVWKGLTFLELPETFESGYEDEDGQAFSHKLCLSSFPQ